jgi:Ca-activated chloride channel family protein
MGGTKLEYAKQAASYAVQSLLPEDRVSIISYASKVEVVVESVLAHDKAGIIRRIQGIEAGGMTALHDGWLDGAGQVGAWLDNERINRVILLSDGQANVGETSLEVIGSDVASLAVHGVSTTAMGVGRDFSENLMQAIATSGDGNFCYIESPEQLPAIFDTELQGLMVTRGSNVRLQLTGASGASLVELLNDFGTDEQGHYILPNLVSGMPILLAGILHVPALPTGNEARIAELQLSWDDTDSRQRQQLNHSFNLPAVPDRDLLALPGNAEVEGYFAELRAARAKETAIANLDRQDREGTLRHLNEARGIVNSMPDSKRRSAELRELDQLNAAFDSSDDVLTRKRMYDQVYRKRYSRGLEGAADASAQRITVSIGDLTRERVDAIVNPSNTGLFGTGGVDGAVHHAGGPELTRACREIGRCEPGEAVFTEGFNLPAKFVIHTVGPKWQGGQHGEARILAGCYRSSLQLARKLGVATIAFPSISTGIYGYPVNEAADIAVAEIRRFLASDSSLDVRIVCFDQATADAYRQVLRAAGITA